MWLCHRGVKVYQIRKSLFFCCRLVLGLSGGSILEADFLRCFIFNPSAYGTSPIAPLKLRDRGGQISIAVRR